jgi:hypothetical protein
MTTQDPAGMEWAARLMASLRRDDAATAPEKAPADAPPVVPADAQPEAPVETAAEVPPEVVAEAPAEAPRQAPVPGGAPAAPIAAPPGLLDLDAAEPPVPPAGLLSTLSPTATAAARPAMLESPLLVGLGGARMASVPAPDPEEAGGAGFAEASPLLASVRTQRAREAAPPATGPADGPPEAAAPQVEPGKAAEADAPGKPASKAAAKPVAPPRKAAPGKPKAANPADAAPGKPVPRPARPAAPTPEGPAPGTAEPAAALPQLPAAEPDGPATATPEKLVSEPAKPAAAPAKPAPEPARPAAKAPATGSTRAAPEDLDEVALNHSLASGGSGWTAFFAGGAALTPLPLRGALAARKRGKAPKLHVAEGNGDRMDRLRSTLAAEGLDGGDTCLLQTHLEADPARLSARGTLIQDLLEASETWDFLRIGLPGLAGALLRLDAPLLTRKVRWLLLLPGSRMEEAEALCHLLRARWRLVAERPALLNPARPAVAIRPGAQLWRGPLA